MKEKISPSKWKLYELYYEKMELTDFLKFLISEGFSLNQIEKILKELDPSLVLHFPIHELVSIPDEQENQDQCTYK